jgi:hypothetical protein
MPRDNHQIIIKKVIPGSNRVAARNSDKSHLLTDKGAYCGAIRKKLAKEQKDEPQLQDTKTDSPSKSTHQCRENQVIINGKIDIFGFDPGKHTQCDCRRTNDHESDDSPEHVLILIVCQVNPGRCRSKVPRSRHGDINDGPCKVNIWRRRREENVTTTSVEIFQSARCYAALMSYSYICSSYINLYISDYDAPGKRNSLDSKDHILIELLGPTEGARIISRPCQNHHYSIRRIILSVLYLNEQFSETFRGIRTGTPSLI